MKYVDFVLDVSPYNIIRLRNDNNSTYDIFTSSNVKPKDNISRKSLRPDAYGHVFGRALQLNSLYKVFAKEVQEQKD